MISTLLREYMRERSRPGGRNRTLGMGPGPGPGPGPRTGSGPGPNTNDTIQYNVMTAARTDSASSLNGDSFLNIGYQNFEWIVLKIASFA